MARDRRRKENMDGIRRLARGEYELGDDAADDENTDDDEADDGEDTDDDEAGDDEGAISAIIGHKTDRLLRHSATRDQALTHLQCANQQPSNFEGSWLRRTEEGKVSAPKMCTS